jgi:hypothetical protein
MWTARGSQVDVAAPAANVWRASVPAGAGPGNVAVGQGTGTSYSVALTAGVAALWIAHHGRGTLLADAHAHGEKLQHMFLRLVRATARKPAGWNTSMMGAGIVQARALLQAPLGLGRVAARARAAATAATPTLPAADPVAALVADLVGPEAVGGTVAEWRRYGPEVGRLLLERRAAAVRKGAAEPDDAAVRAVPAPAASPELDRAVRNPHLREVLGLAPSPQP